MKKSSKHIWMTILGVAAVAGGGVWAYEKFYAATTIGSGTANLPTPSNGNIALALPHGATGWSAAAVLALGGVSGVVTVPSSPTSHLHLTVQKGSIATVAWSDSNNVIQTTVLTFT